MAAFAGLLAVVASCGDPGPAQLYHRPVAMRLLGEGGDPLVIMIGIEWAGDGWCSGQFTVTATETPTEIRVDDVVDRPPRGDGGCAGLGASNGRAWVDLTLSAPIGTRTAVRASDGFVLPVVPLGG